jgi:hypothetical protein
MRPAARAGNREHAPAILAAITTAGGPAAGTTPREEAASTQLGTWEWEGGHLRDHETAPDPARPVPAGHSRAAGPRWKR